MMKKLISMALLLTLLVGCATTPKDDAITPKDDETVDTFTTASINNFYGESGLTGDKLWEVLSTYQSAPTIATVNPDGTPNLAVFMPGGHMTLDGEDYFVFGLMDNQTKLNLEREKLGVLALYIYTPTAEAKTDRNVGARIKFEYIDEEATINKLKEQYPDIVTDTAMICKAVEILPLG